MKTMINGKDREWPAEVQAKWASFVETSGLDFETVPVTMSNYYYPRPFKDEYNMGSRNEGFVYTLGGHTVCMKTIKMHTEIGGDGPRPTWLEK